MEAIAEEYRNPMRFQGPLLGIMERTYSDAVYRSLIGAERHRISKYLLFHVFGSETR